ncbi:Dihydrolipoyllysine-residue succinyltransferase component of 2-oxoglutarate dehydrogenase complex [Candidatus Kinetoplastibacterium sorsogonicusi]|uniref:Dihydrolipoyllysine-residue succinyltransferase component of 2-oxoglutarate dehydrogenase complex n=1 Tax=Candidatus Kinetoplastidibacterium kentomonadis TaxID=1576550 RepID=A0A3Q8EUE9_9PROT|nr:2-oxoglutarate dehydrogenase complex dihydrolipoyllysine-residue succinyltransferase [Candidatus Kinetoplastibacterium sorsogonicusi]AWD32538.1 Dihydrolipoyllysine-residue succinyltransferase component of 2-oxoglutarate dehydrogenase complex [Candidatus Kinetoplastibacterium sorsogonicusi]
MSIIEVVVPQLSESISEATMLNWKKAVGSYVELGEILIELETDKVVLEVPAPSSGILVEIIKSDGSVVTSGDLIAKIDKSATIVTSNKSKDTIPNIENNLSNNDKDHHQKEKIASPSATKILAEKNINIDSINGTGRDGRITKEDALNANSILQTNHLSQENINSDINLRDEQRVPMSRLRARIAERLLQSQRENAILTTFNEVNMQSIIELRKTYKDKFEKKHGVKLGFMSFFVKAAVEALKQYPLINASIDGKDIIYHGYFDIGIAVGSPRGLVVPILRNADQLSIAEIEMKISDFGKRAAIGKLDIEEMTGGTFSISNGGVFGSMLSTPIINPPQSAILGIHATKERPVVENGQIVIRPMNYLALSYDHRIIDGREAVLGLVAIKESLEDPQRLLLDL